MVTITQLAEQKIKELMTEEKDVVGLRIYVRGGAVTDIGTGWLSSRKWPTTIRLLKGDVKVIMDSQSTVAAGAEVDYVDSLGIRIFLKESPSEDHLWCGSPSVRKSSGSAAGCRVK